VLDFDPANRSNWDPEVDIKKSLMWQYCGNSVGIWRCPADRSFVTVFGVQKPRIRSMAMSIWVGGWCTAEGRVYDADCSGPAWRVYSKFTDMVDPGPSRTWVLLDEREDRINYGNAFTDMTGYPDVPTSWRFHFDYPGGYHHRAGGFSFADGHAEMKKWLDERTVPPIVQGGSWSAQPYVPSARNPDIFWLQDRSTRKK
jgi:hypothetical protein